MTTPMVQQYARPTTWQLFRVWAGIGLQSFGGGASTSFLIQRTFIDTYQWMTMEEFLHFWNLCQFAPGINLVALTILIGRKLGGTWGIVMSLAGMLIPSATITCLLTAGFRNVENIPAVQAALKGILPATAGVMFVVGLRFAQPIFKVVSKEGIVRLIMNIAIILLSAVAIILLQLSAILVLFGAALLAMLLFTSWRTRPTPANSVQEGE